MDTLFRGKTILDSGKKKKRNSFKTEKPEKLPLTLPKLEPEVDIDFDTQARDASVAARAISQLESNAHAQSEADIDHESDSDESDYLNNNRDDTETARRRLDEIGQFEMNHNWRLHEGFKQDQENFQVKSRKIAIVIPDENPLNTVNTRIQEIQQMVKPKAELGNFIEKLPQEQRARIMVCRPYFAKNKHHFLYKRWPNNLASKYMYNNTRKGRGVLVCTTRLS